MRLHQGGCAPLAPTVTLALSGTVVVTVIWWVKPGMLPQTTWPVQDSPNHRWSEPSVNSLG